MSKYRAVHTDFPANPVDKAGYQLEFLDEFSDARLNEERWLPFHLPQWSSRRQASANFKFETEHLVLKIDADQSPWCPQYDGDIRVSSLQTGLFAGEVGSQIGQHRFNQASVVRESQINRITYAPQYGYFELRAKGVRAAGNHVALWMIGYEDSPERSSEICVCEIFGAGTDSLSSEIGFGVHPFNDPTISDDFRKVRLPIDISDFHIYAAEWTPNYIDFYVDNQVIGRVEQSPQYRMQFMLGIYERPQEIAADDARRYPKRFVIDYFRAYQPIRGYR